MEQVSMPRIIGLCGDIGSGKSTVAWFLRMEYGYSEASFAAKLKAVAKDVFGLEERHVNGSQADKAEELDRITDAAGNKRTPRFILEWLGTEGCRTIDPDVWVKYVMRKVDAALQRHDREARISLEFSLARFVFEDVRFPNEFQAIRDRGGVVWEVVRVGGPEQGGCTGHSSDDAWRHVRKDAHVPARHGDMDGLKRAVANTMLEYVGA
jgi:hypothetical protein